MDLSSLVLQISFLTIFVKMLAFGFVGQEEKKCKYLRVEKLLKIRCYDMNLKEVPQYLKSSVEILDLTYNRIKKLKRNSFERYSSVKYLVLYENMIQSVEPGTFQHLKSLQEIDLSNNALMTIPLEIFQLPSLRNLYMDSNDLFNLHEDLNELRRPIRAPLEYLNIADCGLSDLPDLGLLPKLWHINASNNPLTELSINRFAEMCNLRGVDFTRTLLSPCACQQVNNHMRYLGVNTKYVPVCPETLSTDVCPTPYNVTVQSDTFAQCKNTETLAQARSIWIYALSSIGGILAVLLIIWYCVYRKRKQRAKRQSILQKRKNFVISPKNAINNHHHHDDEPLRCDNV